MNRLLTLASSGLFATGLMILPVTVFAQPNASTGASTGTTAGVVTSATGGHDVKATAPAASMGTATGTGASTAMKPDAKAAHVPAVAVPTTKDVHKDAASTGHKDTGKADGTKMTTAPVTAPAAPAPVKSGG